MRTGDLDWTPAPHESHAVGDGVTVQLRQQIEKVTVDGVAFYRPDWQGVVRREPRIVRDDGSRVVCALWALGGAIEDRLALDHAGEILERFASPDDGRAPAPLPPLWAPALAELIARESAPPLGAALRDVMADLRLEWGAVPGDLLRTDGDTIRLSRRLRDAGTRGIVDAEGPERARRAIAFVLEVARLVAPDARRRAQARLAAASAAEQAKALRAQPIDGPLSESVGKLVSLVARGHG
jgi:hypothetical protein